MYGSVLIGNTPYASITSNDLQPPIPPVVILPPTPDSNLVGDDINMAEVGEQGSIAKLGS